jgi:outer membrane receptor protein involved in Fe transport
VKAKAGKWSLTAQTFRLVLPQEDKVISQSTNIRPTSARGGLAPIRAFYILLVALLSCVNAIAQVDTAQINGTVRDQNGAVVPNAKIELRNLNTGFLRKTVTNSTGTYVITQIPPGTYSITAGAAGFASQMRSGVALSISQNTSFDFALKPGAITEMVTVTVSGVTVDTSSTTVGATLETKAVNDLPLAGRNYTGLLLLQTGVTPINNDQTGGRTNAVGAVVYPSIQGQNNRSNIYLLDDVNNNEALSGAQTITPSPDDIQEMKVVMHTDSAQFGGGLGGTVNVITKSGTNQFHGEAWEFWRSSEFFDAKSAILPVGQRIPDLHQNQFGGNFGGPVLLPHYNGKNRTFFFGSYEGYRQTTGSDSQVLVPLAAYYTGDFSALLAKGIQLYNPFTANRDPFPNNQIPSSLLDPNMVKVGQMLYPAPTGVYGTAGQNNYRNTTPNLHNSDQFDIRGDEYLSTKDTIWGHYLRVETPVNNYGGLPGFTGTNTYYGYNFGSKWTHDFSPSSILTVGFGRNTGYENIATAYSGNYQAVLSAGGFAQGFACKHPNGLHSNGCEIPGLGFATYAGVPGESALIPNSNSLIWEGKADLVQIFGRHTFTAGFNLDTNNLGPVVVSSSSASFSPFQTSNPANAANGLPTGGDDFASFLLGLPTSANNANKDEYQTGGWVNGFYGQDQWKIRDNLTLNVGLRYDVSLVPVTQAKPYGAYFDIFDFDNGTDIIQKMPPACSATQFAPCLPGGTLPAHVVLSRTPGKLYASDFTDIQPRVGISYAYRPGTVIHVSFGRSYDNWAAVEQNAQNYDAWLMQTNTLGANFNTQPGLTAATETTAENPLAAETGNIPAPTPFGSISWNSRPQFRNAYSDQWTVGVQQTVRNSGVWTINYVASAGRHIDYAPVANTAKTPGPGPVAPRTPYPYMPQSFYDQPIGKLDYNSLQTTFQGRTAAAGLTYLLSYTWAKGLDYGTDGWFGIGTTSIENPYDMKRDRSVTGYDLTHVFTAGWTWALPVGKGHFTTGNHIADYALGNWQINGIATLESGRPFTVQDSGDIANTGNYNFVGDGYERPNQVGNPKLSHPTPAKWFNTAAFVAPAQYTFGNVGRNTLRTQPYKNLDLSLFREFPFWHEGTTLQLRLDAFNAFNHPVWGTPNTCQNCQNFGVVNSTVNSARQMQVSGKIVF